MQVKYYVIIILNPSWKEMRAENEESHWFSPAVKWYFVDHAISTFESKMSFVNLKNKFTSYSNIYLLLHDTTTCTIYR